MDKKFVDVHLVEENEQGQVVSSSDFKDLLIKSYNVFLTRQHLESRKMLESPSLAELARKNRELENRIYHYEMELKYIREELSDIRKILGSAQDFSSFDPDEYFTEEEINDIMASIADLQSGRFKRFTSAKAALDELNKRSE